MKNVINVKKGEYFFFRKFNIFKKPQVQTYSKDKFILNVTKKLLEEERESHRDSYWQLSK